MIRIFLNLLGMFVFLVLMLAWFIKTEFHL